MRCVDYRWLLRVHSQASIEFTVITEKKILHASNLRIVFRFSRSVESLVTWDIAFWSRFSTSSDKTKWQRKNCLQETVGKIDLLFSIFFVEFELVRTLHGVFGVHMMQTTKL